MVGKNRTRSWLYIPAARSKSTLRILGFNLHGLSIPVDMSEKRERISRTLQQSGKRGAARQKNYLRNPLNAIKTVDIKGEISLTRKSANMLLSGKKRELLNKLTIINRYSKNNAATLIKEDKSRYSYDEHSSPTFFTQFKI